MRSLDPYCMTLQILSRPSVLLNHLTVRSREMLIDGKKINRQYWSDDALIMFEFVPILKGAYLTYGEYLALLVGLVGLLLAFLFWLLGSHCYSSSKKKIKVKVDHIEGSLKLKAYNDVLRALGLIFTMLSAFFLCLAVTTLSAFNIIPKWVTILLNKLILIHLFAHILVKMDGKKMKQFTFRRGFKKLKAMRDTRLRSFIFFVILVLSVGLPTFFNNTCVCLYEESFHEAFNLQFLGLPASVNTQVSRIFQVTKACNLENAPCHVYATLPEDTATKVFINMHVHEGVKDPLQMHYIIENSGGKAQSTKSKVFHFKDLEDRGQRRLHTFLLENLVPNSVYTLTVSIGDNKYTFRYRTLATHYPESSPLQMISGGDIGTSQNALKIWQVAATKNPDLVLLGGDLAYDNNILGCYWTWDLFLDQIDLLNERVGRLVPVILAVGNHDYGLNPNPKRELKLRENHLTPVFLSYFPQHLGQTHKIPDVEERRPYFVQKVGRSVIFTLDSGYQNSYKDQAQFIDDYLSKQPGFIMKFAQYHHPIYSSCALSDYEIYNFEEGSLRWLPMFDKHHFTTVYENHQHTLKRTKLMKANKPDDNGTLYLGDGSWGAGPSYCAPNSHDYLASMFSESSVWLSQISERKIVDISLGKENNIYEVIERNYLENGTIQFSEQSRRVKNEEIVVQQPQKVNATIN